MNTYAVILHWVRSHAGRTVYVVQAEGPIKAIIRAVEKDNCHDWSYYKIEVEEVDEVLT